ncbi:MAG: superoxide dismutase [Bacteroidales bacterium]|nr:superoxide dismutase [Bacteroidales bacterium]
MIFELPKLPYSKNALAPVISEKTIEFHYGKHHQAYVDNLNNLIKGSEFEKMSLEEIIKKSVGGVFNNAAQVWNHTFYFEALTPKGGAQPKGKLAEAINEKWGSFEKFKAEFTEAGKTQFGSGWVWLVKDASEKLTIMKEGNAGNPMTKGFSPIFTIDVWEHAYYLDYQNKRPAYLDEIWKIINWDLVESRF